MVSVSLLLVRVGRGALGAFLVRAGGGLASASPSESWRVLVGCRRDPVPGMAFGVPVRPGRLSIISDDGGGNRTHSRWPHTPWVRTGFRITAARAVMVKTNKKGRYDDGDMT